MLKSYCPVLTIAGSDSSGGAGIQADIKSISATGAYAASVITALTAQNTMGVFGIRTIKADFVLEQLDAVFSDIDIKAVKIGMLPNLEIIIAICDFLQRNPVKHLVIDPVMLAQSGDRLISLEAQHILAEKLFGLASLITPNIIEAEVLTGKTIKTKKEMFSAAILLSEMYQTNVLLKGGHLESDTADDIFISHQDQTQEWFSSIRIMTKNTHGTGCSLSAAIASFLAQGKTMSEAIGQAKIYLEQAIFSGKDYFLGKGPGPIDHFFKQSL